MAEEIHQLTLCPVCIETYQDPRNLSCGHSLCLRCVTNLTTDCSQLNCPVCRQIHLNFTKPEAVPKSLTLQHLTQALANFQPHFFPTKGDVDKEIDRTNFANSETWPCHDCQLPNAMENLLFCKDHNEYVCYRCHYIAHRTCKTDFATVHSVKQFISLVTRANLLLTDIECIKNRTKTLYDFAQGYVKSTAMIQDSAESCMNETQDLVTKLSKAANCKDTTLCSPASYDENTTALSSIEARMKIVVEELKIFCAQGRKLFKPLPNQTRSIGIQLEELPLLPLLPTQASNAATASEAPTVSIGDWADMSQVRAVPAQTETAARGSSHAAALQVATCQPSKQCQQGSIKWYIEGIKQMSDNQSQYSPQFKVMDLPWRLFCRRKQNPQNKRVLELYLTCSTDQKHRHVKSKYKADLCIRVQRPQLGDIVLLAKDQVLTPDEFRWGSDKFCKWEELMDTSQKILVNNIMTVDATVKIVSFT